MRMLLTLAAAVALTAFTAADDKTVRERKVRVALALAGEQPSEACGQCREDVTEARADALRDGKPVVLFVGGCPGGGLASAACAGGGIPVKTPEYTGDDRPKGEKRIVVLEPKADGKGFVIADTLPATSTAAKVTGAVSKARPAKDTAPLNWDF